MINVKNLLLSFFIVIFMSECHTLTECDINMINKKKKELLIINTYIRKNNPVYFYRPNGGYVDSIIYKKTKLLLLNECEKINSSKEYKEFINIFLLNNYYNDIKYTHQSMQLNFSKPFDKIIKDFIKMNDVEKNEILLSNVVMFNVNHLKNKNIIIKKIDSLQKVLYKENSINLNKYPSSN